MEQHQSDQTHYLRSDHRNCFGTYFPTGDRNLHSRRSVRRSTSRNRTASCILPDYEFPLPHAKGQKTNMSFIVILYLLGNLFSALSAVIASYLFPVTLTFSQSTNTQDITPPTGVTEVLKNLLMNVVANPVDSLVNANYIGILAWAIILWHCS